MCCEQCKRETTVLMVVTYIGAPDLYLCVTCWLDGTKKLPPVKMVERVNGGKKKYSKKKAAHESWQDADD